MRQMSKSCKGTGERISTFSDDVSVERFVEWDLQHKVLVEQNLDVRTKKLDSLPVAVPAVGHSTGSKLIRTVDGVERREEEGVYGDGSG